LTALTVGAVAVVLGVVLGRKLAQPLRALTGRQSSSGQGDFSDVDSGRRHGRDRDARQHDGRHA
jgi:nitrogen fixation/metabolism regulation signal transduction histidine kinase